MMKRILSILFVTLFLVGCSGVKTGDFSENDLGNISDGERINDLDSGSVNPENLTDKYDLEVNKDNSNKSEDKDSVVISEKDIEEYISQEFKKLSDDAFDYLGSRYELTGFDVYVTESYVKIKWDKLPVKDFFKYYKVMYSDSNPDVKYPDQSAIKVVSNYEDNEYKFEKKLSKGKHYFRVSFPLSNGVVLHSRVITIIVEDENEEVEEEENFKSCWIKSYDKDWDILADYKFYSDDVDSESECLAKYSHLENEIACSASVIGNSVYYRDDDGDEFEEIEELGCSDLTFDAKETIALGEGETYEFELGGEDFTIKLEDISEEYIGKVTLNGVSATNVPIFERIAIGDGFIQVMDILVSYRDSVKSYSQFIFGNYAFELTVEDMDGDGCYDSKKNILGFMNSEIVLKTNVCINDDYLLRYECDNYNFVDSISAENISCANGCSDGSCIYVEKDLVCNDNLDNSSNLMMVDGEGYGLDFGINVSVISVSDSSVLISVNGYSMTIDVCEVKNYMDYSFLVTNIYPVENGREASFKLIYRS